MKKYYIAILICFIAWSAAFAESSSEYIDADIYVRYIYWDVSDLTSLSNSKIDPYVIKEANIKFKNLFGFELFLNYLTNKMLERMDFNENSNDEILYSVNHDMQSLTGSLFFTIDGKTDRIYWGIGLWSSVKKFTANGTLMKAMPFYSDDGSFVIVNPGDNINYFSSIEEYRLYASILSSFSECQIYAGYYTTKLLRGIGLDTTYSDSKNDLLLPYYVAAVETNKSFVCGFFGKYLASAGGFGFYMDLLMDAGFFSETYTTIFSREEGNQLMRNYYSIGLTYSFGDNFFIELGFTAGFNWWMEQIDYKGEMTKDIIIWNSETNVLENIEKGRKITVEHSERFDFLYGPYFELSLRL